MSTQSSVNFDEQILNYEDVVLAKIIAMCVLFTASMICGTLPFQLAKWFKWTEDIHGEKNTKTSKIISYVLSFGGGVLLCTTFQHLLPEVDENIESLIEKGQLPDLGFSLAEFLMCMGFFIIYLIEEIVHLFIHRHEQKMILAEADVPGEAFFRGINPRESVVMKRTSEARRESIRRKTLADIRRNSRFSIDLAPTIETIPRHAEHQHHSHQDSQDHALPIYIVGAKQENSSISDLVPRELGIPRHSQHHHHGHHHIPPPLSDEENALMSSIRGLLIVLALSVHELFEGLAIGLEASTSNVWYMFGAVSAHKFVIAFCVGAELFAVKTRPLLAILYVFTFAVVSPIGIGLGILFSHGNEVDDMAVISAILQGLASGTLLYIIFFEVLSKDRSGIAQLGAVLLGFFIMFGLKFLTGGHSHSHDDHDNHVHHYQHDHHHDNGF